MIKFTATKDQVKLMVVNAINASRPEGLGIIHYEEKTYGVDAIEFSTDVIAKFTIKADYFKGRMVKLAIFGDGEHWEVGMGKHPTTDYQSWARVFPTFELLAKSAGVTLD